MDFELNQEQIMFRDMAREFAKRELDYKTFQEYERADKFDVELYRKLGKAGFLGMLLPKEFGGLGLGFVTVSGVVEEISKVDSAVGAAVAMSALPGIPIALAGTEAQKEKYLPALISGEKQIATAGTEPNAGTDGGAIETTAQLDGDEWVLNGIKAWIGNAYVADVIIVLAQTDKSKGYAGQGLFLVDKDTPGVHITKTEHILVNHGRVGNIRLANCRIPKENLLGGIGTGLKLIQTGIDSQRWNIAISCVGMAQGLLDRCVSYTKTRQQFNKPIASFQLVQGILADMDTEIEAARWLCYHLAYLIDKGGSHRKEASITKLFASEMAMRVTANAIHLHGAYGCTDDLPLGVCYREAPINLLVGGTSEIHRLTIGRALTGISAIR